MSAYLIDDEPQLITNTDIATFEHLTDFKFYDQHFNLAATHEAVESSAMF
ncbi:hypothetical protein GCM10011446_13160 [Acinetobacter vivianii]|nr:hypothetical protein GCM10011446_13160 [Acinetobacter vivianii]